MSWIAYIRKGFVYVPSSAITTDGIVVNRVPVEFASANDVGAIESIVRSSILRGVKTIEPPPVNAYLSDPLLYVAGVKTWSSLYKGCRQIGFFRGLDGFEVFRMRPLQRGYTTDESTRMRLSASVSLDQVVQSIAREIFDFAKE
jgi:hypothetical protein